MRRRDLFPLIFLTACSKERTAGVQILPATLEGGWRCENAKPLDTSSAPEQLRQLGVRSGVEGNYVGRSAVRVRVFDMPAQASAFEAVQKTRPEPGLFFFYKGRFFVMVECDEPPEGMAFVSQMEKALPGA